MDEGSSARLNEEIRRHKKALAFFAKTCDWMDFQSNAAMLFDYLESVELTVLQRKLRQVIGIISLAVIIALAVFNISASPLLTKYRGPLVLIAAAAIVFELILLFELRLYVNIKAKSLKNRKDRFIRNIEHDFKDRLGAEACNSGT